MLQLIQVAGALLILAGFVLAQFRVLDPRSLAYLLVNAVGSAILTVDAWREAQWGFFLLELVWALVSISGLASWRAADRAQATDYAIASSGSERTENGRRQSSSASPSIVSRHS